MSVEKFFYIYSFSQICALFPRILEEHIVYDPIIRKGWVPSMKEYTGKVYRIVYENNDFVSLDGCPFYYDKRLGKILEVNIGSRLSGYPFLIKNSKEESFYISTVYQNSCVGNVINMRISPVPSEQQQLRQLFRSCKK